MSFQIMTIVVADVVVDVVAVMEHKLLFAVRQLLAGFML
jgi:hypothetical protein